MKVLLDSSGWIEFFTGGPLAERYAPYLTSRYQLITPTVDVSLRHGLAMAQDQEAEVVTGDADLKNLPGVVYVK